MTDSLVWRAWTAGIIDGEGSLSITASKTRIKGKRRACPIICVRMTDKNALLKLKELWGGKIHTCKKVQNER